MFFKYIKGGFFLKRTLTKWFGFVAGSIFFILTLYTSNYIAKQIKKGEEKNIVTIVKALETLSANELKYNDIQSFALKVTQDNSTIPMILVDEKGDFIYQRNMDKEEVRLKNDKRYLKERLEEMKKSHLPILVKLPFGSQKIYYENSYLLSQVRLYPILLISIVFLFVLFVFWYFKTIELSKRGFLWAGMAKETAHQIGTPLSSLLGWLEILKMGEVENEIIVEEMQKDIMRLNQIAERFSKIGSKTELKRQNVVAICTEVFDYMKSRFSSQIEFQLIKEKEEIFADVNSQLLSWVIENLFKNAVDAMQNKGVVTLEIKSKEDKVFLLVTDTGNGILSGQKRKIFEPGFTTKKRGWGLGLSLAKRIIEDYHRGEIQVLRTDKKGTAFQVLLPKNSPHEFNLIQKIKYKFFQL